jgi:hypothetical protein
MRGAVIFVIAFLIFLFVTLNYKELPPGRALYGMLGVEDVEEEVQGIPATLLVVAVFNGVVYGFIIWLIQDILFKVLKLDRKSEQRKSENA